MGFDTVKNGIVGLLNSLGYAESQQAVDFKGAPANEYENTFILKCLSGNMDNESSETIIDRFYDFQDWQIQIAFSRNAQNDIINRDNLHRKKDDLLKYLDKPANWISFVRILKYQSWKYDEMENYYILTINLKVQDTYTY